MPTHTCKTEGSFYELTISDIDSESDKLFAINEWQLDDWEKKAKESYVSHLLSAVWSAISGGEITGVAKTKTEITIDETGVVACPPVADIDYWKEVLNRIAKQESESSTPLDHCKDEEGLGEWLSEISDNYANGFEEVADAFRALKQASVYVATVWDAAYYIDADREYPVPAGWEIRYVVPDEVNNERFLCNIYPKGGNDEGGKWIVVLPEDCEALYDQIGNEEAARLDAAVYAAVTAGEAAKAFSWSNVYVFEDHA